MKNKYKVRNWSEYNKGLKQRGNITFWISEEVLSQWIEKEKTGKKGASNKYSDIAIATMITIKNIFNLAGRQTQGFVESLLKLMKIELPVPDHSTVSRRLGKLSIKIPVKPSSKARHIVVDSTGIKVYGEGEWKTRQHGIGKRRTWRKLHLAIDEATGEILMAEVTTNDYHDSEILPSLLEGINDEITQVSGDGAYDTFGSYEAIGEKGALPVIPPQKNAIVSGSKEESHSYKRDKTIMRIEEIGRKEWKKESGYHRRSIAENTMLRLKVTFGGKVKSRDFENQASELLLQCSALNRMIQIAKPDSYIANS